jgi:hypothetical protein
MGDFDMRKTILVAAMALACGTAHAQGLTKFQVAQSTPAPADAAPAAPVPLASPAPQAAAPDAAPAASPSKPAKKRVAARRRGESQEEKARRIAAKYGVSW